MPTTRQLNRLAAAAGLLLLGWAIYMLFFRQPPPEAPPEPLVRPARTLLLQSLTEATARSFPGRVQSGRRVDLAFRVAGPLVRLPVKSADVVEEGQVLAVLDPRDYENALARIRSSLQQARAQLKAMKAGARAEEIRVLEEDVASSEASYRSAREQLDRYDSLIVSGAISQREHDQAKRNFEIAEARLEADRERLKQGLAGARAEDLEAQEALISGLEAQEREAQDQVEDCALVAPFAGQVARVFVDNFQNVRADQPIVSLQDTSHLEVVIQVPETVASRVSRENVERITGTFDFAPDTELELQLVEAETEADRRTQTYAVTLSLPVAEGVRILPGMTATVRVFVRPDEGAEGESWPVPADSVFSDETGGKFVWKVDAATSTVHQAAVETGALAGDTLLLTGGVAQGDRIVTAGVHSLLEGMEIRPMEQEGR